MSEPRICGQCEYLKRTSPQQIFLLCTYWADARHSFADYTWLETHCHLQPEAPACHAFKVRRYADERRQAAA